MEESEIFLFLSMPNFCHYVFINWNWKCEEETSHICKPIPHAEEPCLDYLVKLLCYLFYHFVKDSPSWFSENTADNPETAESKCGECNKCLLLPPSLKLTQFSVSWQSLDCHFIWVGLSSYSWKESRIGSNRLTEFIRNTVTTPVWYGQVNKRMWLMSILMDKGIPWAYLNLGCHSVWRSLNILY